ncbi:MAG TPA: tetratricopeptide repeat protein [Acidimicrobiales bacterium]|nr:tetratricopeptide repeat protein [Acidimicrobiales bacterium]
MQDVTDATFQTEVLDRSSTVPVVVDLWAPWCGPCRTLGPMLEQAVAATEGAVELAKVNVDENPQVAATFRVQSIPAVFAVRDGQVVDGFIGAIPQAQVDEFVARLGPAPMSEADQLVAAGDEASLRKALDLQRDHPGAVVALARLLVDAGQPDEALELLARVPETADVRAVAALARLSARGVPDGGDVTKTLDDLLGRVRDDEDARQEFLDVLETLGPDDPRAAGYRRALASRLF